MKDLRMSLFRRGLTSSIIFILLCSGFANPAHADELSDLQASVAQASSVLALNNAQFSEISPLIEKDVATLDDLNKKIVANQNQTNGAIISVPLDNELQAQKKALEKVILDRSVASSSLAAKINAMTIAIKNLKLKIERLQNGGTISPEDDPVSTPSQTIKKITGSSPNCPMGFTQIDAVANSNSSITITCTAPTQAQKVSQNINYAYAGDEKSILAMTTVLVDMIKANASSGLPVSRSVTKGSELVCTISGNTLTFNTEGICNITISQAGDPKYDAAELQISLKVLKNPKLSETSACSSQAVVIENSFARTYEALRGFDSVFGSSESAANVFVGKGIKTVDEANAYFNSNYSYVQSVFTAAAMELKSGKLEPACLQNDAGKEVYSRVMNAYNALNNELNIRLSNGKSNLLVAIVNLKLSGTSTVNQSDCENLANDFISSATNQLQYMDYITSQWSNLDSLLEYATQNRLTTWDQMINAFKGKIEYANQALGVSQGNFYGGKLEAVCKGTQSGDQLIAKVDGYFGKGAILNQALTRMDQSISLGFNKFSTTPLISGVATCSTKFNSYSSSLNVVASEFSAFAAKVKAVGIPSVKLAPDVMNSYLSYSVSLDAKLRGVSTTILDELKKYPECQDLIKLYKSAEEYLSVSSALQFSIKSSTDGTQNTSVSEDPNDPTLDGEEEAPYAAMKAKRSATGTYTIWVSSNIEDDDLIIKASKKGSKTVVYKIHTQDDGNYSFKTNRNLKGFKLTLYYLGDIFTSFQL
ncbi:MAG: hypothetical protein NTV47_05745 [Actinobacteria bacterium]|nr:hypothetical protein [Actinomycetota bacterium]